MAETWYPALIDVVGLHGFIMERTGQAPGVLIDPAKLEAALMRPQMASYYEGADIPEQAALLVVALALCHAFNDGNKRTAVIAGDTFLTRNGFDLRADERALEAVLIALVAEPEERDRHQEALVNLIREHLHPIQ